MKVGFIGLGIMGLPMARNVLEAGHPLTVHSRTSSRADDLVGAGAVLADTPAAVAACSDVVITMLPDSPDVVSVVEGDDGLLRGSEPGAVWIDMSSIAPSVARMLAERARERGVESLDAPVSGGEAGAIAGSLSIMVGGPEAVFELCRPVLETMGASIVHVGDAGAGQVAKVCNQMVVGVGIAAVAEALTLGAKAGVEPARIREALLGGFAQSRVLDVHGQRMLDGAYAPGFRVRLHRKDMGNALESARAYTATAPLAAIVAEQMNALIANGGADLDHAALMRVYEAQSGIGAGASAPKDFSPGS
jgi:2-hydroxy-3-oxopropionate reductase